MSTATSAAVAAAGAAYEPSAHDTIRVLALLHHNGVVVQNARRAYEELKQHESNPSFCMTLAYLFHCDAAPQQLLLLPPLPSTAAHESVPWQSTPWTVYRRLAGLTLKNNLDAARHALGEGAVYEAARCALHTLRTAHDATLARVAAQIVVKVTALTSFDWWVTRASLGDLAAVLLQELLPAGGLRTLAALYTLQYLMEDLPRGVGAASEHVLVAVTSLCVDAATPLELCKAAFRMCYHVYEQSALLEWDVATLSPLQQGLVNASGVFAEACATLLERGCRADTALATQTMRACVLLLDYFDYFMPPTASTAMTGNMSEANGNENSTSSNNNSSSGGGGGSGASTAALLEQRFCHAWVGSAVRLVCGAGEVTSLSHRHGGADKPHAASNGAAQATVTAAAGAAATHDGGSSSSSASSHELMAAAVEFVTSVLDIHDRSAGESAAAFLAQPLEAAAAQLTPALVRAARLSDEEVADILHADDYRTAEEPSGNVDYSLRSDGGGDIARDDALDEDAAAMTLRRAALKCVEALSVFATGATLPVILAHVEAAWNTSHARNNNNGNSGNNGSDDDWRAREVAVVLLGTIAVGCATALEAALPSLVQQLTAVLRDAREHVCVRSIAAWSLSRWLEATLTVAPALLSEAMAVLIACLQSTSRRLQLTSVSALNEAMQLRARYCSSMAPAGNTAGGGGGEGVCADFVAPHRAALLQTLYVCLPVYTTRNLVLLVELLCQVLLQLLYASHDTAAMQELATRLHSERMRRAALFEQTYMAVYVHHDSNNSSNSNSSGSSATTTTMRVDKDVFALDRALIALLALLPERGMALDCLNTWCAVLQDMLARNVADEDADVVCNTLLLCAGYISVTPTAQLQPWLASSACALTTLACQLFVHCSNRATASSPSSSSSSASSSAVYVRGAAVVLLRRLAHVLGTHAFAQREQVAALLSLLTAQLTSADEHDIRYKADLANLICLLALDEDDGGSAAAAAAGSGVSSSTTTSGSATTTTAASLSEAARAALQAVAATLRSDSYGDSLYYYAQMTFDLCRIVSRAPSLSLAPLLSTHMTTMSLLLAQADNSLTKAEATRQFCAAVCAMATRTPSSNDDAAAAATQLLTAHVPALLQLVCSWPQTAESFAGAYDALRSLMHVLALHCRTQVVQQLQTLSPAYRDVVVAMYDLQQL